MVYVPTKFSLKTANVGKCAIDGFYDDFKVLLSSSQGKHSRKIIAKTALVGDKLVPRRVYIYIYQISNVDLKTQTNMWGEQVEHSQHDNFFTFSQAHVHSMSGAFIDLLTWQTKNHHPCR